MAPNPELIMAPNPELEVVSPAVDSDEEEAKAFVQKLESSRPSRRSSQGWSCSNGPMDASIFPMTRNGRLQQYSAHRRWIGLNKGWSRVGAEGTDQFSHRTRRSSQMKSLIHVGDNVSEEERLKQLNEEALLCRSLIAQLCEQYYQFGWATGTAGGVSIRVGGPSENRPWRVFVAPSGIQKEDMIGDDVFELDMNEKVVHGPKTDGLKLSACTPIWFLIYKHRPSAMSIVHTHSMNSQLATLLDPTEKSKTLTLTHLEMVKGVGGHSYDDVLEIPILDNRPSEDMLAPQMEEALLKYPKCTAVLVRRHGLFVWGDSWEQAKTQAESYDYLFETALGMRRIGVDFSAKPSTGTYRVENEGAPGIHKRKREAENEEAMTKAIEHEAPAAEETPSKKLKSAGGWNAAANVDNHADLMANKTPLLPRDYRYLLLDIEGCTTAISFVKDVLFPYVLEHAQDYIAKNLSQEEIETLAKDLKADLSEEQIQAVGESASPSEMIRYMVKNDLKLASLKSFQGKMWKDGYNNGTLQGHVYEDFVPMLEWMKSQGVKVYIYSSGSVQAQKLLFGKSIKGDLTSYFAGHFDITTSGNKKQSQSYTNIAKDLGVDPSEIVFCSDAVAELEAATSAGIGKCIMTVRPGNAPLSKEDAETYPQVFSLLQLCGSGL